MWPLNSCALRETTGAQSLADDVLRAESSAGYCPPAALVQEPDKEAALTWRMDNYATTAALVRSLHRFPHQGGIDWDRRGLARDGKEKPRFTPGIRLKCRLVHSGMFVTHVEIRFQFLELLSS